MGTIKEIAKQTQMIINKGSGQLLTIKGNNKTDASTYYLDGHVVKQRQNASVDFDGKELEVAILVVFEKNESV
jgi:hypothetical protein